MGSDIQVLGHSSKRKTNWILDMNDLHKLSCNEAADNIFHKCYICFVICGFIDAHYRNKKLVVHSGK